MLEIDGRPIPRQVLQRHAAKGINDRVIGHGR